jgi:ABC-type uncharacterized transport system permease subunit
MPTFAKLIGAVSFALVGFWCAQTYNGHLPDNVGLPMAMAVLGLLLGWGAMGASTGKGYRESVLYGLRTSVLIGVIAMFGVAVVLMLRKSTNRMSGADPLRALLDIPDIIYHYGHYMMDIDVLMALGGGGILGGLLSEFAAQRWS